MLKTVLNLFPLYQLKMTIRDLILWAGNPFHMVSFSPQHKRIQELSPFDTIVHVGADTGQESVFYEYLRTRRVFWIEANPNTYEILVKNIRKRKHSVQIAANALVSSTSGKNLELNLFSLSGANSVYLPTKEFLDLNSKRFLTGQTMSLVTSTLPKVLQSHHFNIAKTKSNLLVIDVEGHELEVLKGCSSEFLSSFDFILCEVSKQVRHFGAVSFTNLTTHLNKEGFTIDFEGPREIFDDVIFKRDPDWIAKE